MNRIIKERREALVRLCQEHDVLRLDVFGSGADGDFDRQRSDLDFLVEFHRGERVNIADQYFGLLEGLEALFDRSVDLVCASAMRNPYFVRTVNATRQAVYAA